MLARPPTGTSWLAVVLIAATLLIALPASVAAAPGQGAGGPVLVVTNPADPFGRYYAEILTAEGMNGFEVRVIGQLSEASLSAYSVVILAQMSLSGPQVSMLSTWVQSGGNLIAMRPDKQLAGLLGLQDASSTLANGYMKVDAARPPGAGIVDQTMQFHGTADRYAANGASTLATLYADAGTATPSPAVTVRNVGPNGGQAAAFTYDLARSIVYTRQGNPAWAGQERDGLTPIRSDDLFFGGSQPDWIDLNKVAIPQADEQQRLLANLITRMSTDRVPLPRFWYFPRGEKAVVVMTGDDHAKNGTQGRFNAFKAASPAGCSVVDWECVRGSSYIYPQTPLAPAAANAFEAEGFEIGVHITTNCADYTPASLATNFSDQLAQFATNLPALPAPTTNRTHCIAFSDWASQPKVELQNGIRLDTNYYYWPPAWVADVPGMFTGSGMPMRFADLDGTVIDVYQAATQMTDESGQSYPFTPNTLLDRALGPEGYYGAFTANAHTDQATTPESEAIVASAQARGVPIVSGEQMLTWLNGRNNSSFSGLSYDGANLRFALNQAPGARGLEAMVPVAGPGGRLLGLSRDGVAVAGLARVVKGIEYAVFPAAPGNYVATYPATSSAPAPPAAPVRRRPAARRDPVGPRVRVRPLRVRAGRRGFVKLRLTCPRGERHCQVDLQLRLRARTMARAKRRVAGGRTRALTVRLRRPARRKLEQASALRMVARAAARDAAGNRAVNQPRIQVLAPRER